MLALTHFFSIFMTLLGGLSADIHTVHADNNLFAPIYYATEATSTTEDVPVETFAGYTSTVEPDAHTKLAALTFDDGPRPTSTAKVLAILAQEHIQGTFFLIGKNVELYPDIARNIVAGGHVVGIHTYDHPKNLPWMPVEHRDWELSETQAIIASSTGVHTWLFRPPYGIINQTVTKEFARLGYTTVLWNVDPRDWDYRRSTKDAMLANILSHLQTHMVILFHDGRDSHGMHDNLAEVLPSVIQELRDRGYTFVTIDKVIHSTHE